MSKQSWSEELTEEFKPCKEVENTSVQKSSQAALSRSAFDEVRYYVNKIQTIVEKESFRVQQEKEAFDSVAKKLKHVHFSSTIQLNVGGQLFTTSLETLTKDAGSMLHAMFSGRFDTKPAEDGSYFIDRDGTHFRYILNYLRTGKLSLPDDRLVKKDVLEEAEFYQIQRIVDKLKPKPYIQSVILSPEQRLWLTQAVGKLHDNNLVYRATRNGWSSSAFHSCCDGKGPTMIVIKSNDYVFGGYTSQSWDSSGIYKTDSEAFLFTLKSYGSLKKPTMIKIKADRTGNAIYGNTSYGPTFGGGHDLYIVNNPHSSNCSVNIGNTYECPQGYSGTQFLTGNQNFTVSEMEVFELFMEDEA